MCDLLILKLFFKCGYFFAAIFLFGFNLIQFFLYLLNLSFLCIDCSSLLLQLLFQLLSASPLLKFQFLHIILHITTNHIQFFEFFIKFVVTFFGIQTERRNILFNSATVARYFIDSAVFAEAEPLNISEMTYLLTVLVLHLSRTFAQSLFFDLICN